MTPAVILAGGRSSRMGSDKCFMPLHGKPLLSHVLERVKPQVSRILINSNGDPLSFGRFGLPVRADALPGQLGPLAGLLTGLLWAREMRATHVMTVACDTPFLPRALLARLSHDLFRTGADIAVARDPQHLHPVIGLWPAHLAGRLAADIQAGTRSVHDWLRPFRVCESVFDASHFANLNTEAELAAAEARIRSAA